MEVRRRLPVPLVGKVVEMLELWLVILWLLPWYIVGILVATSFSTRLQLYLVHPRIAIQISVVMMGPDISGWV